jgi:ABC-type phosphate transport system auxiliary subunit
MKTKSIAAIQERIRQLRIEIRRLQLMSRLAEYEAKQSAEQAGGDAPLNPKRGRDHGRH